MRNETFRHTKSELDKAGIIISSHGESDADIENSLNILNNYRSAHDFALNTFQTRIRSMAKKLSEKTLVAQRLKRTSSIVAKLQREPGMRLSRMQDMGGCRAVLENIDQINKLKEGLLRSKHSHELKNQKDYIANPKPSGYRSVHLVYSFQSLKRTEHNGRLIEIQIRTGLQHSWATAVETVGTFLQQSLKSSQGSEDWLKFFACSSSAFAIEEKTALVPNTPENKDDLFHEIRYFFEELDVKKRVETYAAALRITNRTIKRVKFHYALLNLNPSNSTMSYSLYKKEDLSKATDDYLALEKQIDSRSGSEVVLVSVDSIAALSRAYPNYYLDTSMFFDNLSRITGIG